MRKRYFITCFISVLFTLSMSSQTIISGPVISGVNSTMVRIMLQYDAPGEQTIYLVSGDGEDQFTLFATALPERHNITIFDCKLLHANTTYAIIEKTEKSIRSIGSFKTFPFNNETGNTVFTFGSCIENVLTDSVFIEMKKHRPDFFLHLGDWTYPDHPNYPGPKIGENYFYSEDYAKVIQAYEVRYSLPNMKKFIASTPMDFIHDDDDFVFDGNSRHTHSVNGVKDGKTYIDEVPLAPNTWENAVKGYLELFPHYPLVDSTEGVFHSFRHGNVEIFFLDSRANRSPETGCLKWQDGRYIFAPDTSHRMLGKKQMEWLKNGLKNTTAHWKFIVSGTNFNKGYKQVMDMALAIQQVQLRPGSTGGTIAAQMAAMWIGYPYDQAELMNFLHTEKIKNVMVLSGDAHTSAIDDGRNSGIPEVMSGNLGVRNERLASIVYNDMGLNIWNQGGQGIRNENFNNCFGKIEVFGNDSVRCSIIDMYGTKVCGWTMHDGHQVKSVKLKQMIQVTSRSSARMVANFLKLAGKQME